jgi:hypothetical protein
VQHLPDGTEQAISACNNEFIGRVGEDGFGYITGQVLSGAKLRDHSVKGFETVHLNATSLTEAMPHRHSQQRLSHQQR